MYRVRVLFRATLSHLHHQCSSDTSSRRKRQADEEDQLQYLSNNLMVEGVADGKDDIAQVFVEFIQLVGLLLLFYLFISAVAVLRWGRGHLPRFSLVAPSPYSKAR